MKIDHLTLSNFRCFEKLTVSLEDDVTIFVAANGGGKTTILDGISAAFLAPSEMAGRNIDIHGLIPDDFFLKHRDCNDQSNSVRKFQGEVILKNGDFEGESLGYQFLSHKGRDPDDTVDSTVDGVKALETAKKFFHSEPNPIFAYYQSTRYLSTVPTAEMVDDDDLFRYSSWRNALNACSDFRSTVNWLRAKEEQELRLGREKKDFDFRLPELEAVRKAAATVLDSVSGFFFSTSTIPKLMVRQLDANGNEEERLVSQLGAGHRNMFALVVDFARRMAQTNPQLEKPNEAEAVLVIDEIDLHLHPAWQQRVIGDLKRAFPNTQIITSTHSPQVITSVESRSVRILENGSVHSAPSGLDGAESSRALQSIFGTPSRPPGERTDQLIELSRLISNEKFAEAEKLLETLKKWSQGQEPYLIEAEDEIENRKWLNAG